MKELNNGKASGYDNISNKLIRAELETSVKQIHKLLPKKREPHLLWKLDGYYTDYNNIQTSGGNNH